ncbi:MAG: DUF5682 family protein [Chloroflexota bacterium]
MMQQDSTQPALTSFEALNQQILAAAEALHPSLDVPLSNTASGTPSDAQADRQVQAGRSESLAELLQMMMADVERAVQEPLAIFPVKHHSPASALHLVRRLRERPPKVIYMEGCEDMLAALNGLEHCRFPVAIQAFAPESDAFPADWLPLNLIAPLTEFSAEYQAIAFAKAHPETELVFVDRSADHYFQWLPKAIDESDKNGGQDSEAESPAPMQTPTVEQAFSSEEREGANLHVGATTLQVGNMTPAFDDFLALLLQNARVKHYSEWWTQYVEGPTLAADYETYRHVFFLMGSLLRRLGISEEDRANDQQRERFMWSRMNQHLRSRHIDPADAIYICGAIHAVADIPEFGTGTTDSAPQGSGGTALWTIPSPTETKWLHGIVPSSYAAIEHQFGLPAGEIAIAKSMWEKALRAQKLKAFKIEPSGNKEKKHPAKAQPSPSPTNASLSPTDSTDSAQGFAQFLTRPPDFIEEDSAQLLRWCSSITSLARKHGYSASTADSIAIFQTANLLANLRDRPHPSPYDFQEAAITCLEKDRVPKKRNIQRLTEIMLGGDRIGRVGYDSLPPLARDVYDRLAPLGIDLESSHIQRALMDFNQQPELIVSSDLLWKLHYLGIDVRPIMGERTLGHKPLMESWDIAIGKRQTAIINLAYEGTTVEQVLEQRLRKEGYGERATAATALKAAEDSILYLKSPRFTRDLGMRATVLLVEETGAADAPVIFQRIRRLVHFYRSLGLPTWIKDFVKTGYQHYATLLPLAFDDQATTPQQLAAMLSFIFTQEALAFSMGCERSQILIAMAQATPKEPAKVALLWAGQWILNLRDEESLRREFSHLMTNPLLLPAFPEYVAGFLLALEFSQRITRLAVELISRAFAELPDEVLVPWLPKLIVALRPLGSSITRTLIKEAALAFPRTSSELDNWQFPWERRQRAGEAHKQVIQSESDDPIVYHTAQLLRDYDDNVSALATRLGIEPVVAEQPIAKGDGSDAQKSPFVMATAELLKSYPAGVEALATRLGMSRK